MTKRKDGLWQEQMTVIENGQKKSKYFYGHTKREVLDKIAAYQGKAERGPLFEDVADEWDTAHREAVSYNGHRAYSVPYKATVDRFRGIPIRDITAQDVNLYIDGISNQGYAKRTVKGYVSLLNLIYVYAINNGYCATNPAAFVTVSPRLKTEKRGVPDQSEIEKIKINVNEPFGLFAFFLLYTGCRRGEALALTYDDIDYANKTIRIDKSLYWINNQPHIKETKTEAGTRTIILLDVLRKKLPKKTGYVFGINGQPFTAIAWRRRWEKYVENTSLKVTPHQLRHLFATVLYECGIDEKMAQELMGHSSIKVTRDIYTHIRQGKMADAAQMLNDKIVI